MRQKEKESLPIKARTPFLFRYVISKGKYIFYTFQIFPTK